MAAIFQDPRWMGAYWLGWNILGALMFLFAGLIGLFPKNLPKKKKVIEYDIDGLKSGQNCFMEQESEHKEQPAKLKGMNDVAI